MLRFNTPILELTNLPSNSLAGHHAHTATPSREAGSFADPQQKSRLTTKVPGIEPKAQLRERKNRANALNVVSDT